MNSNLLTASLVLATALNLPCEARGTTAETAASIRAIIDNAVQTAPNPQKRALTELRHLDSNAIPALVEVFTGRDMRLAEPSEISDKPLFEIPPPPDWINEVLLDVLEDQDGKEVGRTLARFAIEAQLEERLLCLKIAERMKGNRAVDAWITLVDGIPAIRLRSTFVSAPAERSLTNIVTDAPRAVNRLADRIDELEPHLHPAVARAVGSSSSNEALKILADLYGRTIDLDLIVLREAGRLSSFRGREYPEIELRFLTDALRSEDPRYRSEATVALARLEYLPGIDAILDALEDPDRRVSQASLWALRHLSGQEWDADHERWSQWWQQEQQWKQDRLESAVRQLSVTDPAQRLAALDELGAHRVFASQLKTELERVALSGDEVFQQRVSIVLKNFGA